VTDTQTDRHVAVAVATLTHCVGRQEVYNSMLSSSSSSVLFQALGPYTHNTHNTHTLGGVVVSLSDSRLAVVGSNPGHGIAGFSEVGDRFFRVNYLGCNHHLDQLSLASLRGR